MPRMIIIQIKDLSKSFFFLLGAGTDGMGLVSIGLGEDSIGPDATDRSLCK